MRRRKRKKWPFVFFGIFAVGILATGMLWMIHRKSQSESPGELIVRYMKHIEKQEYQAMYSMINQDESSHINEDTFIKRNSQIYEGIEAANIQVSDISEDKQKGGSVFVTYTTDMDSIAGKITFHNKAVFVKTKAGYRLLWQDYLIFPDLQADDKVRVSVSKAERGRILDRNGNVLAGKGIASSVGIVPGKLKNKASAIRKLAVLLNMDTKTIENKLEEKWVKDDLFVPLTTIPKVNELDLARTDVDDKLEKEANRQEQLLKIPGVKLTDVEVRYYSLNKAAAHLIGYMQAVTAEDLENHKGEGYTATSMIGRSGIEGLYEKELKGQNGCEIRVEGKDGKVKTMIANIPKQDGKDIKLTIDAQLQKELYEQFQNDPGCSAAMNPYTGEVLALVSTPSYDNNDFVTGISQKNWKSLNNDKNKPLYNRFRQVWCPGSTFKPIVAGIALKEGAVKADENFGKEGLSWQKDNSWGSYYVTTLEEYEPVILKNALIYSDNIYFAKTALRIGAQQFMKSLDELGFNKEIPFEITMAKSRYSNSGKIEKEIQLADSGYGQGQIMVNPLHLASIYTAFLNDGNILQPYLGYQEEKKGKIWIRNAFAKENIEAVMEGVKGVVSDPNGTGYAAHRVDMVLAGKTGTAEIKDSKEDDTGTEVGWFLVFTTDKNTKKPIILTSMVENVKNIGGSSYVVQKDKAVLDQYFSR